MLTTKSGLSRNKCYQVSLAEKVVISTGNWMVVSGKVSAGMLSRGSWMVESLSKPPGGKCMMVGLFYSRCFSKLPMILVIKVLM